MSKGEAREGTVLCKVEELPKCCAETPEIGITEPRSGICARDKKRKIGEERIKDPSDSVHGTIYGYQVGCKCEKCKDAMSAYNHKRYLVRAGKTEKKRCDSSQQPKSGWNKLKYDGVVPDGDCRFTLCHKRKKCGHIGNPRECEYWCRLMASREPSRSGEVRVRRAAK